jgi:succinoglycan biosynthesis protein ExoV
MRFYQHAIAGGNFGDDLNGWLWPRLLGNLLDDRDDELWVGIGTVLHADWIPAAPRKIVCGSGCGYGPLPSIDDRWRFLAVRGLLTAQRLGLPPSAAITDAAALVPRLYRPKPLSARRPAFIPHHANLRIGRWDRACAAAGIDLIDPRDPVEQVLDALAGAEVVIAEAMHGAILADAYRVPWIPVSSGRNVLDFKWQDWCGSLGLTYAPATIPDLGSAVPMRRRLDNGFRRTVASFGLGRPKWRHLPNPFHGAGADRRTGAALKAILASGPRCLSTDAAWRSAEDRLHAVVAEFVAGRRAGRL